MKTTYNCIALVFLLAVLLGGCERKINFESFNCKDCYQDPSDYGPLTLFFTINEENSYVPFTIYVGDFENRVFEYADTAYYPEIEIDVPVDAFYSVEAIYKKENRKIHVIGGDKLRQIKETQECDKVCYYFKGGWIDVRLKH